MLIFLPWLGIGLGLGVSLQFGPPPQSSNVSSAGVGVVSLRGALMSLPPSATAQFRSFFDFGRAARCLLPIGGGRFMHLVVVYGFQGADTDVTQLELTNRLLNTVLGELAVLAQGQPALVCCSFQRRAYQNPLLAELVLLV